MSHRYGDYRPNVTSLRRGFGRWARGGCRTWGWHRPEARSDPRLVPTRGSFRPEARSDPRLVPTRGWFRACGCHHRPFSPENLELGTCWNILVDISLI